MRNYKLNINEYNKLLAHVDKTIKYNAEQIKIYEELIKGLKSYEGKVLNVRIEPFVQKLLPEYKVHYSKSYNHYYIYANSPGSSKQFCISLVGYNQEKSCKFTLNYLIDTLKNLKERHEKDLLKVDEVTNIVMTYNNALDWFQRAEKELTDIPGWFNFNRF